MTITVDDLLFLSHVIIMMINFHFHECYFERLESSRRPGPSVKCTFETLQIELLISYQNVISNLKERCPFLNNQ